ncbi:uncharacterized protein A1O5_09400 [Cladophialophora psammophila CBS 110553]|uniref:Cupin type-2 domain-containing protein n=1 Tax=Cladophialophora psammophila CBS 110553 TaxID=1182543 RepID=W9WGZ7_9EURO|nr:uncharacterized protein A1O5_09400 [Cladophialophora psammophila CBS 110553]EXJ67387.1 hypothetical protein A1O5_09400 [Cladophialophora psammophila CBS 110553]
MRWMLSWVAGPEGYYNSNPGHAVLSHDASVGFMGLPSGNKQRGLHYHQVTEIYVILKGEVLGWDGYGESHKAGPFDCIYIPATVPHSVRAYGDEDVELIWVHDAIEKKGTSVYWDSAMPNPQDESQRKIQVVPFKDLEPRWNQLVGQQYWEITYVAPTQETASPEPQLKIQNDTVALGLLVIPPAQKYVVQGSSRSELNVVIRGKAVTNIGGNQELNTMDAIYVPAGQTGTLRNHGSEVTYVVRVQEKSH